MHDHDVRHLDVLADDFREDTPYAKRSLQGVLYVDGKRESTRSRARQTSFGYRFVRGIAAVGFVGASFAGGFAAFEAYHHYRVVHRPSAPNAPHAAAPAMVAAYVATAAPEIPLSRSGFLPPVALANHASTQNLVRAPIDEHATAAPRTPAERTQEQRDERDFLAAQRADERREDAARNARRVADEARTAKQHADEARIAKQHADEARVAKQHADEVRIAKQHADEARIAQQHADEARVAKQRADEARIAQQHADEARIAKQHADEARVAKQHADEARIAQQRADEARIAKQHADEARVAKQHADEERIAKQHADEARRVVAMQAVSAEHPRVLSAAAFVAPRPHTHAAAHKNAAHRTAPPSILRFDAAPSTIAAGGGTTICVAAKHAATLSVSVLGTLNPLHLNCRRIAPTTTTTYTAFAADRHGRTTSNSVTVTVAQ